MKGWAVAIIFSFIGVAIVPSINAQISKTSFKSEMVEITTEISGLNDGKHSVYLSKEDVKEVEKLLENIKKRINKAETREETIEIFNEVVVELDKYGLLGNLNILQAQKLVTGGYQNSKAISLLERLNNRHLLSPPDEELLPLIIGNTNDTLFMNFFEFLFFFIVSFFWTDIDDAPENIIDIILLLNTLSSKIPIALANFGATMGYGWIFSAGFLGIYLREGKINAYWSGFHGIKIQIERMHFFYFGIAKYLSGY